MRQAVLNKVIFDLGVLDDVKLFTGLASTKYDICPGGSSYCQADTWMLQQMLVNWRENPELWKKTITHDSDVTIWNFRIYLKKLSDAGNYKKLEFLFPPPNTNTSWVNIPPWE